MTSETTRGATGWQAVGAGLAHGALVAGAAAPIGWGVLSLAALVPLMWVAAVGSNRPWRLAWLVGLGVMPAWLYEVRWAIGITELGYVPFAFGVTVFTVGFMGVLAWVLRRARWMPLVVAGPLLWMGAEHLRGDVVLSGFPMVLLAHPLMDAGVAGGASGLAWLIGAYGVGMVAVLPAAAVIDIAVRRRVWWGVGGLVVFVVVTAIGAMQPAPVPGARHVRIGVVQTNVTQSNKTAGTPAEQLADFATFMELTREAAAGGAEVIVWPETMFPGLALEPEEVEREREAGLAWKLDTGERVATTIFYDELMALSRELDVPMLIGAVGLEGLRIGEGERPSLDYDEEFNSVYLIERGRVVGRRYDKMRLTPFGEVMPGISSWPWLERQLLAIGANGMSFDLTPGAVPVRFEVPTDAGVVRVVTPICFEATMAEQCRRLVRGRGGREADVLINLTNDGWFGSVDGARLQHLLAARWRCLELRTPMVRAANTGISAAIGADGRLLEENGRLVALVARAPGVLMADVAVGEGPVPSGLVGRVLAWIGSAGVVGVIGLSVWCWLRTRARSRANYSGASSGGEAS